MVPAPELREVAETWWDLDEDPAVVWDAPARRFDLVAPSDPTARLRLVELAEPAADPVALAEILAVAFAACDFPPTGDGVTPERAALTLRAHGVLPGT